MPIAQRVHRVQAARHRVCDGGHGTPASDRSRTPAAARFARRIDRGCYGCYGPKENPNTAGLDSALGLEQVDLVRVYRTFNAAAPEFRAASERHER